MRKSTFCQHFWVGAGCVAIHGFYTMKGGDAHGRFRSLATFTCVGTWHLQYDV